MDTTKEIIETLKDNGYDCAVAIATEAEIKNGAACGQLAIITENQ
jgi:adenine C2-methylase RlmN of 23S rRNA A2503 and tRNA A37